MAYKRRLVLRRQGFVCVAFVTPTSCVSHMWITGIEMRRCDGRSHRWVCESMTVRRHSFAAIRAAADRRAEGRGSAVVQLGFRLGAGELHPDPIAAAPANLAAVGDAVQRHIEKEPIGNPRLERHL